jgi:flagellar hook protein FlgE
MQGAAAATGTRGGTNPIQIGLGMGLAAVDTIMTSGSYQPTGKQTDLAIQNQGFFIVSDGLNQYFTRAGNFDFDGTGNYVVPGTGLKVMGWLGVDGVVDTSGQVGAITIPSGITLPAVATTSMTFINNLSGTDTPGSSAQTSLEVYDSLGRVQTLQQKFIKTDDTTRTWLTKASLTDNTIGVSNPLTEITFDSAGKVNTVKQVVLHEVPSKNLQLADGLKLNGTLGSLSTLTGVTLYDSAGAAQTYDITFTNTVANATWTYAITDALGATVQTGTASYAAGQYSFTTVAGTLPALTLSNSIGRDPAALPAGVFISVASTGLPQSNIRFASGMQLDSTVGNTHDVGFTLYDVDGQAHNYNMRITTAAGPTYSYNIYDAADTTFSTSLGDGTITAAGAAGNPNYFVPGTAFDPWGTGGITPVSVNGVVPAAGSFVGSVAAVLPGTSSISIPTLQMDNTTGSVHQSYYTVFDNALTPHVLKMEFTQTADNTWSYKLNEAGVTNATSLLSGTVKWDTTLVPPAYVYTPAFNNSTFDVGTGAAKTTITLGNPTTGVAPVGTAFIAACDPTYGTAATVSPVTFTAPGATQSAITMDVSAITQYGGSTTVQANNQNGNASGALDTVSVDTSGMIVGKFSNGKTQNLARVALATFTNNAGLTRVGDTLFAASNNSGNPAIGTSGTGGRGTLTPGSLEMSNIDLADQFSKMIITQRGFQANSKIITTSDTMLEELVNLKR